MVVFGGDNARDAEGGDGGIEKGRLDSDGEIRVNSLGGWHAGARVDVDNFSYCVRMDEVAGDYQVVRMPLRVDAPLAAAVHVVIASIANEAAGRAMTMRLTMSSGSSGRSETCSSSNSLGMCRDTSFMANLASEKGYGSVQLICKQIRYNVKECFCLEDD